VLIVSLSCKLPQNSYGLHVAKQVTYISKKNAVFKSIISFSPICNSYPPDNEKFQRNLIKYDRDLSGKQNKSRKNMDQQKIV
jgi:hypothetical protein